MSKGNQNPNSKRKDPRKTLGDRLRECREYVGFSQEEVATYLKVPRSALSLIESGQRKVDALELKKLANLYQRPVAFFTDDDSTELSFSSEVDFLARKVSDLSSEDREELSRFADFLRSRKQSRGV